MKKLVAQIVGACLCIIGLLGMLTPIPFGLIFFVAGLMFLIPTTPWVAQGVRGARRRSSVLDRVFGEVGRRLPHPYRRILRQTQVSDADGTFL